MAKKSAAPSRVFKSHIGGNVKVVKVPASLKKMPQQGPNATTGMRIAPPNIPTFGRKRNAL